MRSLLLAILFVVPALAQAQVGEPRAASLLDPSSPFAFDSERYAPPPMRPPLGPAIGVVVGGGATGAIGVVMLLATGLSALVWEVPPSDGLVAGGSALVGIGLCIMFGGIYWLMEHLEWRPDDPRASREPWALRF